MKMKLNRRTFLAAAAKTLGGTALVSATSGWMFAVRKPAVETIHRSTWQMGTLINLTLPESAYRPGLADVAFAVLGRVDQRLTTFREDSDLIRMNHQAGQWLPAEYDLENVSRAALQYGALTDGALDVSVLPLMKRYGFVPGPVTGNQESLLERIDYARLHVRPGAVMLEPGGYEIDFGGIAKGYGVDEAVAALQQEGVPSALLEAGGDLYALGRPEPGRRWKIGIRNPLNPEDLFATLEVEDEAVATSGLYAQTRVYQEEEIAHIVDPRTGKPVRHTLSATIVTQNALAADALATAVCVLDPRRARHLVESLPDTEGLWIFSDKTVAVTSGLANRVTMR